MPLAENHYRVLTARGAGRPTNQPQIAPCGGTSAPANAAGITDTLRKWPRSPGAPMRQSENHYSVLVLNFVSVLFSMGWVVGFEPTATGTTIRRSTKLSYTHRKGPLDSIRVSRRAANLQPRLLPQCVHPPLHFRRHLDHVGPWAREAFPRPFARGVYAHLRAVIRKAARMIQ